MPHSHTFLAWSLPQLLQRSFDEKEQVLAHFYKKDGGSTHASFPPLLLAAPPSPSTRSTASLQQEQQVGW